MEGGPKLQAEKPIDEKARMRHLTEICSTAREYVEKIKDFTLGNPYLEIWMKSVQRAKNVLTTLCRNHSL